MVRETSTDFLRIDISSKQTRRIISACQNDTIHRTIHFLLSNNGIPMDLSNLFYAEIIVKRVDGTETDNPCIIEGNDIQYTLNNNDIAVVGENEGHLFLTFNDGSTFESPVFYLNVFSTFYNPAALQSQNEYLTLTQQVLNAESYANSAAESVDAASEYANNASENATAAATAASEAADIKSETADLKSETADYLTSTSEYAASASAKASEAASDAAVANSCATDGSGYAATAHIEAQNAANYMQSTSEYVGSASEYAATAASETAQGASYLSSTSECLDGANSLLTATSEYNDSASNYASSAASEAAVAEGYAGAAQRAAASVASALRPMGTVAFASLPALSSADEGDMYNISDAFETTSDFEEGSGKQVAAGANVYKTYNGKWDILAGAPVTGVKGDAETNYRIGNVNITKTDIGLGNVRNEDIGDEDISGLGATVKAAILALNTSFSNALTALKNTAIAQAVGATGTTFASVITTLGTIVNRGSVTQSLDTTTTSYTVPEGYHDGTGTVSITTEEKSQTAGTSNVNVTPTSGKVLSKVVVSPTPSQSKTVTASRSDQTVSPDSGKLLSSVTVNKYPDANGTFTPTTHSTAADMGATNNYRYVDTTNAYNKGVTDGRVGYMVTPTATKSITANESNIDVLNYAKVNVSVTNTLNCAKLRGLSNGQLSVQTYSVTVGDIIVTLNVGATSSDYVQNLTLLTYDNFVDNTPIRIYRATSTSVKVYAYYQAAVFRVYRS